MIGAFVLHQRKSIFTHTTQTIAMISAQTQTEESDVNDVIVHTIVDELQFQIDDLEHQVGEILTRRRKSCKKPSQTAPTRQD
jgi:replication initiation and membrane attachment protein DnaB